MVDGVRVTRFPVAWSPPTPIGHLISRPIMARWRREEARDGAYPAGSDAAIEAFHRRALARPRAYDLLALLGRGPWAPGWTLRRTRPRSGRRLAGFTPFATPWQATRGFAGPGSSCSRRSSTPRTSSLPRPVRPSPSAPTPCSPTPYSAGLLARLLPGARPLPLGLGIDPLELDDPQISGARFRQQYGLGDAPLALFVGRKEQHKRYDLAIEAIDRAADPRARLVLVGTDVDRQPIASARALYLGPLPRADLLDAYDVRYLRAAVGTELRWSSRSRCGVR
jgi:glycosyltransferase involved in cell wall biosynthesis